MVSNLVAHGAHVNICDRNGVSISPVLAAAFSKNLERVKLRVVAGASSNSLSVVALDEACEIGDRQAVEALFADGAHINQCNRTGESKVFESPFHVSVERVHFDAVAALLHAGAVSPYGCFHDPEPMPPALTCRPHPHPIQKLRSVYSSERYSCDACSRSGSGWVYALAGSTIANCAAGIFAQRARCSIPLLPIEPNYGRSQVVRNRCVVRLHACGLSTR